MFNCTKCTGGNSGLMVVALAIVALLIFAALVNYLVTSKPGADREGIIPRIMRYVPLQSLKIVIVVWQILTQVKVSCGRTT